MTEHEEVVSEMRRLVQVMREVADEGKRLREALEKVINVESRAKKDKVESTLEALVPFATDLLTGRKKRR